MEEQRILRSSWIWSIGLVLQEPHPGESFAVGCTAGVLLVEEEGDNCLGKKNSETQ